MAENKTNSHVTRLHQYLPFDPSHDQIYEEYAERKDSLELETKSLEYLESVLAAKDPVAIVLTGDAGHGKTHLCRRLLQSYLGYDDETARMLLLDKCNGDDIISHVDSGLDVKPLRIFKDFSEFSIDIAGNRFEQAITGEEAITLICVNEGRLRAILESGIKENESVSSFYSDFHDSFSNGLATSNGKWFIINLNYQSISSDLIQDNLIRETLQKWISGTRWKVCSECSCSHCCPIKNNRDALFDEKHPSRIDNLQKVFSISERLGTVITLREMLMVVAYLLTGGLTCKDVHKRRNKEGWQHEYAYHSLLFKTPASISKDKISRIPVLSAIFPLDPGAISIREIDDHIINEGGIFNGNEIDLCFKDGISNDIIDASNGIDEVIGNARSRQERNREAELVQTIVQTLRRRSFFDNVGQVDMTKRLGFEYADDFYWILEGQDDQPTRKAKIKQNLIAGLHTIQGLNLGLKETSLYLVDPAFGNATNKAAIVACKIPSKSINLVSQSQNWNSVNEPNSISKTVNWLEREIIIQISMPGNDKISYSLDLMGFDYLMRAGMGYISQAFYAHDIRRVLNFLGRLAENGNTSNDGIEAIIDGKVFTVSVEEGNVIQASGGN